MVTEGLRDLIQGYFNNSLILRLLLNWTKKNRKKLNPLRNTLVQFSLIYTLKTLYFFLRIMTLSQRCSYPLNCCVLSLQSIYVTSYLISFRYGVAISLQHHLTLGVLMYSYSLFPLSFLLEICGVSFVYSFCEFILMLGSWRNIFKIAVHF
jgi:hypothetical protein